MSRYKIEERSSDKEERFKKSEKSRGKKKNRSIRLAVMIRKYSKYEVNALTKNFICYR